MASLRQWVVSFRDGSKFVAYNVPGPVGREMAIDHAVMVVKRRDVKSARMLPRDEEYSESVVGVLLPLVIEQKG